VRFETLAGATGLEPATFGVTGRSSHPNLQVIQPLFYSPVAPTDAKPAKSVMASLRRSWIGARSMAFRGLRNGRWRAIS
jgi:hypothetical protein